MSNTTKIVLTAIVALVIGFVGGVYGTHQQASLSGVAYDAQHFAGNVYQGLSDTLELQSGNFVGPILTTQTVTISGTSSLSAATRVAQGFTGAGASLGSAATTSVTAAQVCGNASLVRNPATAGASTTLPTATTLSGACMTANNDVKDIVFLNTSATAGSTTIIAAADASTTLRLGSSGTATSTVTLNGGNGARLTFVRTGATTNTVFISAFVSP